MRAMWQAHGKPGGPQPGLVGKPYTLKDARDRLAEVSGDRAFADRVLREVHRGPRRRRLRTAPRARAGIVFRKREPGAPGWATSALDADGQGHQSGRARTRPAIEAGFDQDDVIISVDGKPLAAGVTFAEHRQRAQARRSGGDRLHASGRHDRHRRRSPLAEDPAMEAVPIEATGGTPIARNSRRFAPPGSGRSAGDLHALAFRSSSSCPSSGPSARVGARGRRRGRTPDDRRRAA